MVNGTYTFTQALFKSVHPRPTVTVLLKQQMRRFKDTARYGYYRAEIQSLNARACTPEKGVA